MRAVILHAPKGGRDVSALRAALSGVDLLMVEDYGTPMESFRIVMQEADPGALVFEDDAILCRDFLRWAQPHCGPELTTFFRRDVRPDGVVRLPGSRWMGTVGFWTPRGFGSAIADYVPTWPRLLQHPTGWDLVIRDYLVEHKQAFNVVYPSLVQHRPGKSLLGPRSSFRTSPTWRKEGPNHE